MPQRRRRRLYALTCSTSLTLASTMSKKVFNPLLQRSLRRYLSTFFAGAFRSCNLYFVRRQSSGLFITQSESPIVSPRRWIWRRRASLVWSSGSGREPTLQLQSKPNADCLFHDSIFTVRGFSFFHYRSRKYAKSRQL